MLASPTSRTPSATENRRSTACSRNGLKIMQQQVGHRCDTSTAIYTHVSSDFMNTALRKAISPAFDVPGGNGKDYRWHLRQVMADRGMFATTDLIEPLAARGIRLSSSQVYRLVVERPERLSLKILMALLDILDCSMTELIEPVAAGGQSRTAKAAGGAAAGIGQLRPRRARITRPGESPG